MRDLAPCVGDDMSEFAVAGRAYLPCTFIRLRGAVGVIYEGPPPTITQENNCRRHLFRSPFMFTCSFRVAQANLSPRYTNLAWLAGPRTYAIYTDTCIYYIIYTMRSGYFPLNMAITSHPMAVVSDISGSSLTYSNQPSNGSGK